MKYQHQGREQPDFPVPIFGKNCVLEKTFENPFDCKEIKLINPKENQPRIFNGRTDAEAETPVL